MTGGQKKAWQSQEKSCPRKTGKEQSQVECKLPFLTIQCHAENISIFKELFHRSYSMNY